MVNKKISECKYFAVSFDRKGSLNWASNSLKEDIPGYDNLHIIQVENVKDEYL